MFELIPSNQRRELNQLRREMDSLFGRFFEGWPFPARGDGEWMPAVDVSETPREVIVKAECPGLDPKEIDISLHDGILTFRGERKQEQEKKEEDFYLMERSYGSFARSIPLPAQVNPDKVNATYRNGILEIHMPKAEETPVKKIQVKGT